MFIVERGKRHKEVILYREESALKWAWNMGGGRQKNLEPY